MKSIELKTKEVAEAYNIISAAKYQKLSDDDKVRVWRISRKLCPVAEQYEKDVEDAKIKLLPTEDFPQRLQVALQYQSIKDAGGEDFPISQEEFNRTAADWNSYNGLLNKALKEIAEKTVAIEIEPVTEEAFGRLMASNDWSFAQAGALEFIIG